MRRLGVTERGDTRWTRRREALRTGLWFVPGLFVVAAALGSFVTVELDRHIGESTSWVFFSGGPTSAEQILATIAASMMTVTGLVFTITVVVLQLASNQFSPRVLRTFLRDRGTQIPLGVFIATFVFALSVLVRVRTGVIGSVFVPRLSITVAFVLIALSMVAFVYFVNHVAQSIRVVNIIESVASETRTAIDAVFPLTPPSAAPPPALGPPVQRLTLERHGGVVAGLDIDDLVELACAHDCVLRFRPAMGDYVPQEGALFDVYGGTGDVTFAEVLRCVDIARERSMRQDPGYGFRLLVDIAEKALSPALNDPTTAVQAIDRIHDLLGRVVRRPRPSGIYTDEAGTVRLVRTIVSWDALVALAFEEIREYGGSSVQVNRRLRASLEQLLEVAPAHRREPLRRQLRLLLHGASRYFPDAEERAFAIAADESGMGDTPEDETSAASPG